MGLEMCAVYVGQTLGPALKSNMLQFVEYDQRAHKLSTLAQFSFWIQSGFT